MSLLGIKLTADFTFLGPSRCLTGEPTRGRLSPASAPRKEQVVRDQIQTKAKKRSRDLTA